MITLEHHNWALVIVLMGLFIGVIAVIVADVSKNVLTAAQETSQQEYRKNK